MSQLNILLTWPLYISPLYLCQCGPLFFVKNKSINYGPFVMRGPTVLAPASAPPPPCVPVHDLHRVWLTFSHSHGLKMYLKVPSTLIHGSHGVNRARQTLGLKPIIRQSQEGLFHRLQRDGWQAAWADGMRGSNKKWNPPIWRSPKKKTKREGDVCLEM